MNSSSPATLDWHFAGRDVSGSHCIRWRFALLYGHKVKVRDDGLPFQHSAIDHMKKTRTVCTRLPIGGVFGDAISHHVVAVFHIVALIATAYRTGKPVISLFKESVSDVWFPEQESRSSGKSLTLIGYYAPVPTRRFWKKNPR
jgi:hypothetical protein